LFPFVICSLLEFATQWNLPMFLDSESVAIRNKKISDIYKTCQPFLPFKHRYLWKRKPR